MKPSLKIPAPLHAKLMQELLNLPADVLVAALKKLNSQQWQEVLEDSGTTSKGVMNTVNRLRNYRSELQAHLISQINVGGLE